MENSINLANDNDEKAKFGYQMAVNMVGILGQEIYSRFNAMLTANSIIIAAYVLIFSENNNMPDFLKIFLPIFGIVLCFLWFVFIHHGIFRQRQYRNEAERLEEVYFKISLTIFLFYAIFCYCPMGQAGTTNPAHTNKIYGIRTLISVKAWLLIF